MILDIYNSVVSDGRDLSVLIALATFANRESRECFASIPAIAERARMDKKTVSGALKRLEQQGHIALQREVGKSSHIRITVPATPPASGAGTSPGYGSGTPPVSGPNPTRIRGGTQPVSGSRKRETMKETREEGPEPGLEWMWR